MEPLEIQHFIKRYRDHTQSLGNMGIIEFKSNFARLRNELNTLAKKREIDERENASAFNLFRLLGLDRLENKTHSAMIANLLDPAGSHGQGELFLDLFLKIIRNKSGLLPEPIAYKDVTVHTEYATSLGRLDILIRFPDSCTLIAIENKIDAEEQDKQISRYHDWLEAQKRHPSGSWRHVAIIFLTIDGREPKTAAGKDYIPMSYDVDISQLLRNSLNQVTASRLKESIQQYLEITSSL